MTIVKRGSPKPVSAAAIIQPKKTKFKIIAITSLYTLVAGCACGFVGTSILMMAIVILVCSVLVVVGGLYTGYHFGFESKTGAYVIGALLLWIAGGETLLRSVLHII